MLVRSNEVAASMLNTISANKLSQNSLACEQTCAYGPRWQCAGPSSAPLSSDVGKVTLPKPVKLRRARGSLLGFGHVRAAFGRFGGDIGRCWVGVEAGQIWGEIDGSWPELNADFALEWRV